MKENLQDVLFNQIKNKINPGDSMGQALCDVLSISLDAAYRRLRNETPLTIQETQKLCKVFDISFDSLIELKNGSAIFSYNPLDTYDFSLDSYLEGILIAMNRLNSIKDPKVYLSINNVHFFQMLNFPQLIRFRLYFWAKSHLMVPAYQKEKFKHVKITEKSFELGRAILQNYISIPTIEIVDADLMRGFMRQIIYYLEAGLFEDPSYALFLVERVEMLLDHYKNQVTIGKKFISGNEAPAQGNELNVSFNDTINTDATFLYESASERGVFLTHNIMNYLHTTNSNYVSDTKKMVERQLMNSSIISEVNAKERNVYFSSIEKMVNQHKTIIQTLV